MNEELPPGWEWEKFGEIADTQLGKMLSKKSKTGVGSRPYLRNQNVQWHRFDLDDVAEMDFTDDETVKYELRPGDLLVCEGGEVGRCAMWTRPAGEMLFQKALHRVRPRSGVHGKWLEYYLRWAAETGRFAAHVSGSTINHLPQRDLRNLDVPLPSRSEQEHVVAAIEGTPLLRGRRSCVIVPTGSTGSACCGNSPFGKPSTRRAQRYRLATLLMFGAGFRSSPSEGLNRTQPPSSELPM